MKKVVITGANGMIGGLVLQRCLDSDEITQVVSITRKRVDIHHSKLCHVLHLDFLDFSGVQEVQECDICFYCLGVYTGQVANGEFKKITVAYTIAFARALKEKSPRCTFCFLSGQGADSSEKSRILFAREKGIAENLLKKCAFPSLYIFRPGYIYPVTPREEPNRAYQFMRRIYKPIASIYPNIGTTSEQLASKMFEIGLHGGDKMILKIKI